MKKRNNEKTVPVPRRGKVILCMIFGMLMTASVVTGMVTATEIEEFPVLLSDGEVITAPWYITVDGNEVALVESQEAAEEVLTQVIEEYENGDSTVLDVEVVEETAVEKMDIESGDDPPEIMTADEAVDEILSGDDGESYVTVVTTEEVTEEETIAFEEKYKPDSELYVGQQQVETEGQEGTKEVTKKVVKENGEAVDEEIIDEEIVEEPQQQVVLTGTKQYAGTGDGTAEYAEDGVSCDENVEYGILNTPVQGFYISSGFGQRWGRLHSGIDMALAEGNPIYAADAGTVYYAGYCGSYGNLVKIDHGNGMQTYYAHCSKLLVSEGQNVERGEKIALVGSTGNSTGPHLHFEVIINGSCVDPVDFLEF